MRIQFFITILIVFFLIGFFIFETYLPKSLTQTLHKEFLIQKGEGIRNIALNLKKEDLIKNKYFFTLYVFLKGESKKLQAGKYSISSSESIAEIVKKIVSGDIVKEKITITEGWNLRDIGWYFENKGMFTAEELFELAGKDFNEEFDFLEDKPKSMNLEGYLFPDTYEISPETNLEEIIKKMLINFGKKLNSDLREGIEKQNKSIFEIVTMASLLEKEVKTYEDKEIVSGILWRRLKTRMPLQVDATITYITGKKTTKISKEETEIDSSYNTYKYLGLPLGPISNPGLESIKAALYPEDSEYWYYLSTPEGETIFGKTLEEHNIAKAKYLK